jgi:hypothetical protein
MPAEIAETPEVRPTTWVGVSTEYETVSFPI